MQPAATDSKKITKTEQNGGKVKTHLFKQLECSRKLQ